MTNEQQVLADEISVFKHWLALKFVVTSCTFQHLGLNKINNIIVQHIFNPAKPVLNDVSSNSTNTTDLFTADLVQKNTIYYRKYNSRL